MSEAALHPLPPAPPGATVRHLPPSARKLFDTLAQRGPLTHQEILRETGLPARTARYAVGRLREAGVAQTRVNLHDCRQAYVFLSTSAPARSAWPTL